MRFSSPKPGEIGLQHLYRALDFLDAHQAEVEEELYPRTANLLNLDVNLIFYDTTSVYWNTEAEDDFCPVAGQARFSYQKAYRWYHPLPPNR